MPTPNQKLQALTNRRANQRDVMVRRMAIPIDAWAAEVTTRTMGIVANGMVVGPVLAAVDTLMVTELDRLADILEAELRTLQAWAWDSAATNLVQAVPLRIWLGFLTPRNLLLEFAGSLEAEVELQRILDGLTTAAEAREIIKAIEFPPPSEIEIEAILNGSAAGDGVSAMERIRTVAREDITKLKAVIRRGMAGDISGASAIKSIAKPIRVLVGNDPGRTTGMNYRAQRIARTEGMRIAESEQRRAWEQAGDLIAGLVAMTAHDSRVRDSHRVWHAVFYARAGSGVYIKAPGQLAFAPEFVPVFPVAPNCRGYTIARLRSDLTIGLPPVRFTPGRAALGQGA